MEENRSDIRVIGDEMSPDKKMPLYLECNTRCKGKGKVVLVLN
jgi:hypothetical protein